MLWFWRVALNCCSNFKGCSWNFLLLWFTQLWVLPGLSVIRLYFTMIMLVAAIWRCLQVRIQNIAFEKKFFNKWTVIVAPWHEGHMLIFIHVCELVSSFRFTVMSGWLASKSLGVPLTLSSKLNWRFLGGIF